ncbi:hypothetical protein MLD38_034495 [Melastoma candidum]|uniref:Uncharacterized protein n=1 Tax=Melastoma candidum TaxID=119954 RepID=A0ACB9M9R5_9MYRT|nr:hypothetical protein MLD38_034495 [Melastoma candidum]
MASSPRKPGRSFSAGGSCTTGNREVGAGGMTGLDQKQINNWFINQRKRHWKPSEDMQFMVMDGLHPQGSAAWSMDGHHISDAPYCLGL